MNSLQVVPIELEEFEAMRLCDLEGHEQSEAGTQMQVSRGTIQRLLESGRRKLIQAFLDNQAIFITEQPSCCAEGHCNESAHTKKATPLGRSE